MPNGIINNNHIKQDDSAAAAPKAAIKLQQHNKTNQMQTTILNVAEMILHGVADHEILDIWLRSIACPEFVSNFVDAGYDMPTISRITPQDLTAIGITDPTKRLKILSEIKKLNLQDGIPSFKPASLSHWLSLIRLDSYYYKSLCDQQVDTIEKMCQLTWEDFEELGIAKLGHQKRFQLAIERMKEIEASDSKKSSQKLSEPIYDTNPSQILLVASTENHSINGPIINKQSSTSELSSTCSGSLHSVYSANSIHHQPTYAALSQPSLNNPHKQHNQQQQTGQVAGHNQQQQQHQVIYSQPPTHIMGQQQQILQNSSASSNQVSTNMPYNNTTHSHYQVGQQNQTLNGQLPHNFGNLIYGVTGINCSNTMVHPNRQSMGQLPFSALAKLPKHQQQLLQQSSIYATLSRQPQKAKQPPPPVPIRTNSLKSNSLSDESCTKQQRSQHASPNHSITNEFNSNSTSNTLFSNISMAGANKNHIGSHTMLTKNKSFSGNAYMDAARARFMNRNSQQQLTNLTHQLFSTMNPKGATFSNNNSNNTNQQNDGPNLVYDTGRNGYGSGGLSNMRFLNSDNEKSNLYSYQPASNTSPVCNAQSNLTNMTDLKTLQQRYSTAPAPNSQKPPTSITSSQRHDQREDNDTNSDTNSTKSLILSSSTLASTQNETSCRVNSSPIHDSGSSQTLYNSASSGSNDLSLSGRNFSQPAGLTSHQSATSSSTLNDLNLTLEQQQQHHPHNHHPKHHQSIDTFSKTHVKRSLQHGGDFNATTGKDDDFPPPPSPLSLTDSDEQDLATLNSDNFTDLTSGLLTFRVGS